MQHLEKMVILTLLIAVLIYTILVNQTRLPKDPALTPKQEKPFSNSLDSTNNGDNFFPPPQPPEGAEGIKEESFTESP